MNNRIGDNLNHFGGNEELARELVSAGVRFIVVGGLAVAWHCSEREAYDMDLLVEPTAENSERIANVLARLGMAGFSSESFAKQSLQVPLKDWRFFAELLTPREDSLSFSEVEVDAVDAKIFNIPVRLASVTALIAMKTCAVCSLTEQREKHLKDIALLEQCQTH